jgi:hypothetical protein
MGFVVVGHFGSLTFSPGRTRKSFELIFIFISFAILAVLFAPVYFLVSASSAS